MNAQQTSFTVFSKFGEVGAKLNEDDRKEFYFAVMEYGLTGVMPQVSYVVELLLTLIKNDLDNSREYYAKKQNMARDESGRFVKKSEQTYEKMDAGNVENVENFELVENSQNSDDEILQNRMSHRKPPYGEPYGEPLENATVNRATHSTDSEKRKEKKRKERIGKENTYTQKAYQVQQSEPDLRPPQGRSAQTDPRALAFLCVFNEETGKSFSTLPLECANRLIATAYTTEDVRAMIRHKRREWDNAKMRKFITPKTLFGNKFDAYMDEAKNAKAEVSEYAKYDR
jgi:uncharacterized phage protein (TIGR02220 family)